MKSRNNGNGMPPLVLGGKAPRQGMLYLLTDVLKKLAVSIQVYCCIISIPKIGLDASISKQEKNIYSSGTGQSVSKKILDPVEH